MPRFAFVSVSLIVALAYGAASGMDAPSPQTILIKTSVTTETMPTLLELGVDIWNVGDGVATVRVSPDELTQLRAAGFTCEIINENVYASIPAPGPTVVPMTETWTTYHDMAGVYSSLSTMSTDHPTICSLITIGTSVEGRNISGLRISNNPTTIDRSKPASLFLGLHHAREWISEEVPLYLANYLLDNYATSAYIKRLIDNTEIWIIPVVNPDGFAYTQTTDRLWRKNRRNNGDGTYGVNINRNFSYQWGGAGSSGTTSSGDYRGPSAFSEPETCAVRDLYEGTNGRNFNCLISYHAYDQYIMYPWNYTATAAPDVTLLSTLGTNMRNLITGSGLGYTYTTGQGYSLLYQMNGDTTDWAYGVHGTPAYTIELRPTSTDPAAFELPADQILGTCQENLPAAIYMIDWTLPTTTEYIVESRSGGLNYAKYSETGTWSSSTRKSTAPGTTSAIGERYVNISTSGATAVFSYTPTTAGVYQVFATWASSIDASSSSKYVITHASGSDTKYLNQLATPNQWVFVGEYTLNASTAYTVTQQSVGSTGGTIIRADAIKWDYVGPPANTPPSITQNPSNQTVQAGATATFTVQASGTPPLSYQWQKNGTNLTNGGHYSGATIAALTISSCDSNDAANYRCVVSNAYTPSATSSAASLTITTAPVVYIVESRSGGQNYSSYVETGTWSDASAKSTADGCTSGIGSRWCTIGSTAVSASFRFTPTVSATYEVFTTNCNTSNSGNPLIHKITYAGSTSSVSVCQNSTCSPNAINAWYSLGQYSLNAGTQYSVTLDGSTGAGSLPSGNAGRSDAIKWVSVGSSSAPATPTDGTPTALSTASILWKWSDVSGETGYRVKDTSGTIKVDSIAADSVQAGESGLSANTSYTRRIYAYNSDGESAGSTGQSAYTSQVVPGVPTFSSLLTDGTGFTVGTTGPVNVITGSSGVVFSNGGTDRTAIAALTDAVTGLSPNTQYFFKAKAKNGDGVFTSSLYAGAYENTPTLGASDKWSGTAAATFNGSTQDVDLPSFGTGVDFSGGFTIECYAKPTSLTAFAGVVDLRTTGSDNFVNKICFDLGSAGTGVMRVEVYDGSGASGSGGWAEATDTTNAKFTTDAWHHYAVVVKPDKSVTFYKDGTAYAGPSVGVLPPAGVLRDLNYAARRQGTSSFYYYTGSLDEIAIYTYPLSAAQIAAHKNAASKSAYQTSVLGHGPLAYWTLDDASGTTTAAESSAGYGPGATKYTLAQAPAYGTSGNVTIQCDKGSSNSSLTASANVTFTFNNAFGDGAANVGKFDYSWDTSTTWNGSSPTPTDWTSGSTLVKQTGATGQSYYLHLRSYNNDTTKATNGTVLTLGPYAVPSACTLNAPTAAAASNVATDSIQWNWGINGNTCADGYKVYDAASGGNLKGTVTGNATASFTETGLDPGTSYNRWVVAYTAAQGDSARTALAAQSTTARSCPENGDFESGFTGGIGNHWIQAGTYGTWAQSTATKRAGTSSQQITDASGGNSFTDLIYQKLNVLASRNYTLRVWSYRATGAILKVGVNYTGGTTEDTSGQQGTAGSWISKDVSFTSGATGLITVFLSAGYNSSDGTVFVDGIYLLPQKPSSTGASSTTICSGQSTNLTASGGWSGTSAELHWYTGASGSGTAVGTGSSLTVSPTTTTTYYARWEPTGWSSPCLPSDDGTAVTVTVNTTTAAPSDGTPTADAADRITWKWTDVAGETAYRVKDTGGTSKSGDLSAGTTQWQETNLTANTQYTRKIYAVNACGESPASAGQTAWTLSVAPGATSVTLNNGPLPAYTGTPIDVAWAADGFGSGKVQYYRYAWNQNAVYSWTGAEPSWSSGTITTSATTVGTWYLHVQGYNGANVANGDYVYSVQILDGTNPFDFNHDGHVDGLDMTVFDNCVTGPAILYDPYSLPSDCSLTPDGNGKIAADFDQDGDVDQEDFGMFERCYSGSAHPVDPNCTN